MKKVLRLLVVTVCVGMAANGCKGKEEPIDIDAAECIVGVWGVSDTRTPVGDEEYSVYYRFTSDKTLELYDISETVYRYYTGRYATVENSVRYQFDQFRQFEIKEKLPRYVWHDNNGILGLGFKIKEATESMIRYTNSNGGIICMPCNRYQVSGTRSSRQRMSSLQPKRWQVSGTLWTFIS